MGRLDSLVVSKNYIRAARKRDLSVVPTTHWCLNPFIASHCLGLPALPHKIVFGRVGGREGREVRRVRLLGGHNTAR